MKKILTGIFISFITLVLLALFGEYYLKNFVLVTKATGNCGQEDSILRFKGMPNSQCSSRTPEWDIKFKLNSFGLHNPEITLEKGEGVKRILFLGDSFTQGYGIEEDKSFPRLVEKRLNEKFNGKPKIEVINSGVPNYSPLIEYLYLKNEGYKFNPDLVILEFDLTDFSNDLVYEKDTLFDEKGIPVALLPSGQSASSRTKEVEATPSSQKESTSSVAVAKTMDKSQLLPFMPSNIKKFFHDNSVLYKWLSTQLKILFGQPLADSGKETVESFFTIAKEDKSNDELLWKAPKRNIKLIAEFLKEKNIPFIISMHPHAIQVNGKEWGNGRLMHGLERGKIYSTRDFDQMAEFLKSQSIPFINLLNYFKESKEYPMYFAFDGHFNEKGHKVAAGGIVKELLKLGLINSK